MALDALLAVRQGVQAQILDRVRANLALVTRRLRVEAGWYAVMPVVDEEETAIRLLRDDNVLVQPGYFFDFLTDDFLVVSLLSKPDRFADGAARLAGFLSERE